MSKNNKIANKEKMVSFEKEIMTRISSGEISMKPRWHFIAGSFVGFSSLIGLSVGVVYLTNIVFFLLRKHGRMGQWRLEMMLNSFPWWIPIAAIVGIAVSIWLLKKYDFSYKKNFLFIIIGFIISIIIAAWLIDSFGLNEAWSKRGPMRKFYQQLELGNDNLPGNQQRTENGQGKFRSLHGQ